jgi:uncharacterized membrane protein YgdD (TMEM256/DUF423 family)
LGAFGAHALRARLAGEMLAIWNTAVQYHFWHALGVLLVGLAAFKLSTPWLNAAGWLLIAGVLLFSGSLYALALGAPKALGALTPLGGLAMIAGWCAFAGAALRS